MQPFFVNFFHMSRNIYLNCRSASLFKQFIAMMYDSLLIVALLFLATAILLPFNQGESISGPFYNLYLLIVVYVFYSWFWNKSGQTLGMKAWKIRIIDEQGMNPSWPISFLRLFTATLLPITFLGLNQYFSFVENDRITVYIAICFFVAGYLPRLFSPNSLADRLSQTTIIDVKGLQTKTTTGD
jgi:uncharacterized RDD family membrane protein YckC